MSKPEEEGQAPLINVPKPTEQEIKERTIRPPSHNVGVGGILMQLYRNLIADLTNGQWFSNVTLNKLMNDYLDRESKNNPSFNRANVRGNLMKVIVAKAITFKSFCELLTFAKFTNITLSIEATREDGTKAKASVDVFFVEGKSGNSDGTQQ